MYKTDLSASASDFTRIVWPVISSWCGGGDCIDVEQGTTGVADNVISLLDMRGGIDQLQILPDRAGLIGIASRIQWGQKSWDTFTVRESRCSGSRTELSKRSHALSHPGVLYPYWTVQAYLSHRDNGTLLSVALAYTHELIPYAQKHGTVRQNHDGASSFRYVDWREYYDAGNFIHVLIGDQEFDSNEFSEAV